MLTIADILRPAGIELDLPAIEIGEAIHRVASLLRNDFRVIDWQAFYNGLKGGETAIDSGGKFHVCLPHARTSAVQSFVMSVGKSKAGIRSGPYLIRYIFVIGVPGALASDYLRVIGSLARIVRDREWERQLNEAVAPTDFIAQISRFELDIGTSKNT
jgi:mannitol/fructose-specific phosphotransferase system IIA component (Ntr-type)